MRRSVDVDYGEATLRTYPLSGQATTRSLLRHPRLPACHSGPALGSQASAMETNTRVYLTTANAQDESVLWLMLTFAAWMGSGGEEQIADARSNPYLSTYVSEWGTKRGDLGVIARDGSGKVLGAAWLRLGSAEGPYKLGDMELPELATAVIPQARRRGVGTMLMKHLIDLVRPCYQGIVLSVREENPAVQFYSDLGFRAVSRMKNRVGGDSLVMALDLGQAAQHQGSAGGAENA